MTFSWQGLILGFLPMIPNILFFTVFRPKEQPIQKDGGLILNLLEHGGRILYLFLLVCFSFSTPVRFSGVSLLGMIVFLGLYLVLWIIYFLKKSAKAVFFGKILGIPFMLYMVFFPILFYLFVSIGIRNYVSLVALLLFFIGHLVNTVVLYRANTETRK